MRSVNERAILPRARACQAPGKHEATWQDVPTIVGEMQHIRMTTKRRLSASVDAELVAVAQEAVTGGRAESISAWVNDALRLKADHDRRLQALDDFLAAYEAEHGEITDDEMRDAARRARERAIVVRGDPERRSSGPTQHGRGAA